MIGAVIAMSSEAEILKGLMDIKKEECVSGKKIFIGEFAGKQIALIICGVGKVNAAIGTQILLDLYKADKILNFGVAGGITDSTETKGVYAIWEAVEYDFDLSELNNTKIGTPDEFTDNYMKLNTTNLDIPLRKLATGDRFNDNKQDYLLIKDYMQADIRDMEGAAVVRCAIHAKVPVYSFKAISDKAGNKSSFEQYAENKNAALDNLKNYLKEIISAI